MDLPPEGTRICLAGYLGTVRFAGKVDNTTGIWLGIEWDDPQRGKHDGIKDGKRYFTCRVHNAGSFIRPSAVNLSYGRSFLEALVHKYVEAPHGSQSQEKVPLGSSHGAIMVEAVCLDKIRGKLANLELLREVSLNNENVARCDSPGAIQHTCPSIQGLDLSASLLPGWDVVAWITKELPALKRLALNRNRLQCAINISTMKIAFSGLIELQLNGTMMSWSEMQEIIAYMPKLRLVEFGYNRLVQLSTLGSLPPHNCAIEIFNLDSNQCSDWVHICNSLHYYSSLQRVILTSNGISTIPFPEENQRRPYSLKHISLSFNGLNAWSDVDALSSWCPGLETLTLSGNPLMDGLSQHSRPLVISRIPSLLVLDGAAISPKERTDCELFYLSYIIQYGPGSAEDRRKAHPQWLNLYAKHGVSDETLKRQPLPDKLSTRLITLHFYRSNGSPLDNRAGYHLAYSKPIVLHVLPTMTLRMLRMKLRKVMKSNHGAIFLGLVVGDELAELHTDSDPQSLDLIGLEEGSQVVFDIINI